MRRRRDAWPVNTASLRHLGGTASTREKSQDEITRHIVSFTHVARISSNLNKMFPSRSILSVGINEKDDWKEQVLPINSKRLVFQQGHMPNKPFGDRLGHTTTDMVSSLTQHIKND